MDLDKIYVLRVPTASDDGETIAGMYSSFDNAIEQARNLKPKDWKHTGVVDAHNKWWIDYYVIDQTASPKFDRQQRICVDSSGE